MFYMKIQKIVSITTIIISLSLIIYMCVMMSLDSGNTTPGVTSSPDHIILNTSAPTDGNVLPNSTDANGSTSQPTAQQTPSPTATQTPQPTQGNVTAVPGGKTSTNPNYQGKKIISITFDDGPHPSNTSKVLDMLKNKGVHVTFFVLGENLYSDSQKALVKRAHDEGHEIANHSYSHPLPFTSLSTDQLKEELRKTDNIIQSIIGEIPVLFRPPGGGYNQSISENCGKAIVLWSIDSRDWDYLSAKKVKNYAANNGISEEEAKNKLIDDVLFNGFKYTVSGKEYTNPSIVSMLRHGSIILFHDIHPYSGEAASRLIDYLNSTGEYIIMPVSEMIMTEQRAPQAGDVYSYMWETYATKKQNW